MWEFMNVVYEKKNIQLIVERHAMRHLASIVRSTECAESILFWERGRKESIENINHRYQTFDTRKKK